MRTLHLTSPLQTNMSHRRHRLLIAALSIAATASACADDDSSAATTTDVPTTYEFAGRDGSDSSVSYGGQVMRQLLIEELKAEIGGLTGRIDDGSITPTADGDIVGRLDAIFRFDSAIDGGASFSLTTTPPALQQTWDDVSTDKDLVGKLAGNDAVTDHRPFAGADSAFAGWSDPAITAYGGGTDSPEALITAFFETVEENALIHAEAQERVAFDGTVLPVHVTASGLDLQQLTQKLLTVGITFSQGLDDYLDDDVDEKGLLASHDAEDGAAYTALEHAWDEGFGYFGAARDYAARSDEDVANGTLHDTNGDGAIDLLTEWTTGLSTNAAKRDLGATVATDFSGDAIDAFLAGRALLASTEGALTDEQYQQLVAHRDSIAVAWESALAATVVHYLNDTIAAYDAYDADPPTYDFLDHAKAWSELKGFALGFQFHRNSPMLDGFALFHDRIGDAPTLPNDPAAADYRAELVAARAQVADAFGFDPANVDAW